MASVAKAPLGTRILNRLFGKDSEHEIPNKELFRFSLGVVGQNMNFGMSNLLQYFCIMAIGLDELLLGSVLAVLKIWDAINDPLAGSIIDRHLFKNGEKLRPFLKIMPIPIGICTLLLFTDFGISDNTVLFFGIFCTLYMAYDLMYTFQDVAQWGMTSLMATSSEERGRAAHIGRIAGIIGGWLPGIVLLVVDQTDRFQIDRRITFFVFALLLGFGGMVMSMLTHSAKERAPVAKLQSKNPLEGIGLLLKNRIVLMIVLGSILSKCTLMFEQVYFFEAFIVEMDIFGLRVSGLQLNFVFGLLVGIPGTIAVFFTPLYARLVGGMRNVMISACFLGFACRLAAYFIGYQGINFVYMGILLAVASIPSQMVGIATTCLLGDSLDYIEWKTGKRNEGAVFSMQNFCAKINNALQVFMLGLTLKIMDFDKDLVLQKLPQSERFQTLAWPVFMLAPALGSLFNMIPLFFIRYSKAERLQVEADLKVRRQQKALEEQAKTPEPLDFISNMYQD